ncbi:MAG: hypothetical protein CM15mP103_09870 [Gammaproteobacteria bacterium]|nr:MAG: hypothetical protein CM15mP103_09870 [Gammaproteobacteria bacterium]
MADDIPMRSSKTVIRPKQYRPLRRAVENEQDVQLLERLAFMHRREARNSVLVNFFMFERHRGACDAPGAARPARGNGAAARVWQIWMTFIRYPVRFWSRMKNIRPL